MKRSKLKQTTYTNFCDMAKIFIKIVFFPKYELYWKESFKFTFTLHKRDNKYYIQNIKQ